MACMLHACFDGGFPGWTPDAGPPPSPPEQVFLLGQAAALLARTVLGNPPAVGSISVPELQRLRSPLEEELGTRLRRSLHTSSIRRPGPAGALLVVDSARQLPVEQAVTWAKAVLAALRPQKLVVVTTLPAMRYCGPGSPADEDLVFGLRTSAAAATAAAAAPSSTATNKPSGQPQPDLPPGTMLDGLPAALLTRAELAGLPAVVVVGVQMGPSPDTQFVCSLALGAAAALSSIGSPPAFPTQPRAQLASAVSRAADEAFRSSAGASIFI